MSQVEAVTDPLEARVRFVTLAVVGMVPLELGLVLLLAEDMPLPLLLALVLGTTGLTMAAVWWFRQRELGRRAALTEQAQRLGMQFHPAATGAVLEGFELYRGGVRRNVLFGERNGVDIEVFGYAFGSGGDSRSTVQQTVALLRRPELSLPTFRLRARAFLDGVFNDGGISFADTPEFTSEYHLAGSEDCAVGRLFDRNLRSWFADNGGLWVEGRGSQLLVCRVGKRVAPQDLRGFVDDALRVAERFARA